MRPSPPLKRVTAVKLGLRYATPRKNSASCSSAHAFGPMTRLTISRS